VNKQNCTAASLIIHNVHTSDFIINILTAHFNSDY